MKTNQTKNIPKFCLIALLCAGLLMAGVSESFAANKTWNGVGDQSSLSDTLNWGGAGAAAVNDQLFFAGTTGLSPNNDILASTVFSNITFNATAGAFTLGGNVIKLASGAGAVGGVTNLSANVQTITFNV